MIVFAGTEVIRGDAASAILGQEASDATLRAQVRHALHLDRPVVVRYGDWLNGVLHGNLGDSLTSGSNVNTAGASRGVSVMSILRPRLVNSLVLMAAAALVTIPVALLLGILSALRPGGRTDTFISTTTLGFAALPEFVIGMVVIIVFAIFWRLLPPVSLVAPGESLRARATGLVLPVLTLSVVSIGYIARMVRGSMIEVLESDYIAFARLKGMPERLVITRHALRNALLPTVQAIAFTIAYLIGGIVVVEAVFGYPGIGQGLAAAVSARDIPTVQALALVIAAVYIAVNLAADVASVLLNPRLRHAE
jgi:peptide/nickel transport system permease protein